LDDQIKHWIEAKITSYKKWLISEKLEDKVEYQRYTAWTKRGVRRRHRAVWDRFITNLVHETCWTQSVHSVKTNKRWYKGNTENSRKHRWKCISSVLWQIMEHNRHKLTKIRLEFRQSHMYFHNIKWSRKGLESNKKMVNAQEKITLNESFTSMQPKSSNWDYCNF